MKPMVLVPKSEMIDFEVYLNELVKSIEERSHIKVLPLFWNTWLISACKTKFQSCEFMRRRKNQLDSELQWTKEKST